MDKKRFMNAIYNKDKKLNTFLKNNFFVSENNLEDDTIQPDVGGNIDSLKDLSELEKKIAKARLIQLEESNDVSKFFPSMISIVAALLFSINILVNINDEKKLDLLDKLIFLVPLIIAVLLCVLLVYSLQIRFNFRETAIYMSSLLADALNVEKEDSTKDTESKKTEDEKEIENFSEIVETADSETEKELLKK